MSEVSSENISSENGDQKKLFIICPIGDENSETRIHSDKVKRHLIDRAAEAKNYMTQRADQISEPGKITRQIVQRIKNDEIVVADITDRNPNVFYELALRHAIGKPVILIGKKGEEIPFDVRAQRIIFYDLTDPDSVVESREELVRQITSVESDEFIVDSPIGDPISLEVRERDTSEEILAIVRNTNEYLQKYLEERMRVMRLSAQSGTEKIIDLKNKNIELTSEIYTLQASLENAENYVTELKGRLFSYREFSMEEVDFEI